MCPPQMCPPPSLSLFSNINSEVPTGLDSTSYFGNMNSQLSDLSSFPQNELILAKDHYNNNELAGMGREQERLAFANYCSIGASPVASQLHKKKKTKASKPRIKTQNRVFKNEVDTNVICLKLAVLKQDAEIAAGDPVFCK